MGELLAAVYDPLVGPFDPLGFDEWRHWVASAAHGQVLELGVGTGRNLPHYGFEDSRAAEGAKGVHSLAAVDPDYASLRRACSRLDGNSSFVSLYAARAEALPFVDDSFDIVVGTLVFCTIADPVGALDEAWRVLRPGGRLRLLEHVRVHSRLIGGMQDFASPFWEHVAAGCHLNRDTASAVEHAGFKVDAVHRHLGGLFVGIDATKSDRTKMSREYSEFSASKRREYHEAPRPGLRDDGRGRQRGGQVRIQRDDLLFLLARLQGRF